MENKVIFGDCMDYLGEFPDNHFDLLVADPPYFSGPDRLGYYGDGYSNIGVKRDRYEKIGVWDVPGEDYFREAIRVSKNQIIWGCNYYAGFIPSVGRIIWDKVNDHSSFSDAEVASCSMHDSVRIFRYMWDGMRQGKSIAEGITMQGNKKLNEKRIHATQKPVILYSWVYRSYLKGDGPFRVLDTHVGSGSSRIAAYNYGIDFTGYEKDLKIWEAQEERYQNTCVPNLFSV